MGNKRKPTHGPAAQSKKKKFSKGPKGKSQPSKQQDVPLPPDSDDEGQEYAVEDEDVEFVQQYGSQLGFLTKLDTEELNRAIKQKQTTAAEAAGSNGAAKHSEDYNSEDDAEEYERKPRAAEQVQKANSQGLPVKTATGEVLYRPTRSQIQAAQVQVEGVTVQDSIHLEQQVTKAEKAAAKQAAAAAAKAAQAEQQQQQEQQQRPSAPPSEAEQGSSLPPALLSLMSIADQTARRDALKQQMALAAQHLLADPDKHVGPGLRLLLGCAADRDGYVVRLALLSLLAVFKDLLPGYRIRSMTEEEQEMRVSKEVAALRAFEQSLLRSYQAYLKTLLAAATAKTSTGSRSSVLATARVSVRCMGQLLLARPGFNYSSDLLQALVPLLAHGDGEVREECCATLRQLLMTDVSGKTSLEALQLVADLVRKRKCVVSPAVVASLLVLRFEQVTPTAQGGEGVGAKGGKGGKKPSGRKRKKSDVDRDFEEAEVAPDAAELAMMQSQMLEALFEIFFRVLKHCSTATANNSAAAAEKPTGSTVPAAANGLQDNSNSSNSSGPVLVQPWSAARVAKKFPLLQPCLDGLGRYSHLISVEYFNDLMTVMQQLLSAGALPVRERVSVLLAALDVLKGQGEALTIDRRAFYNHLYNTLMQVPLNILVENTQPSNSSTQAAVTGPAADHDDADQDQLEDQQALEAVRVSLLGWEAAAAAAAAPGSSRQVMPTSVLLMRSLEQQLLGVRQTDMGRLASFTKRLAELMLSSSPSEAVGSACLMWRLIRRYNKLTCQFEWEGGAPVGGRQYDTDCYDPSEAGGMAAALWELPLLTCHYHPHVAAAAKVLLTLTPGGSKAAVAAAAREDAGGGGGGHVAGVTSVITGAAGPHELAGEYEPIRRGGFRPAPVPPAGLKGGRGSASAGSSRTGMAARQAAAAGAWCQDLQGAVAAALAGTTEQCSEQQQHQQGRKRKQRQIQQQPQNMISVQQLMAAADDLDLQQVYVALQQQYRLSKQYNRNEQLRHELALMAKKVELFREHLIQKRQLQQQQQQQHKQQLQQQQQQQQHKKKSKHKGTPPYPGH